MSTFMNLIINQICYVQEWYVHQFGLAEVKEIYDNTHSDSRLRRLGVLDLMASVSRGWITDMKPLIEAFNNVEDLLDDYLHAQAKYISRSLSRGGIEPAKCDFHVHNPKETKAS